MPEAASKGLARIWVLVGGVDAPSPGPLVRPLATSIVKFHILCSPCAVAVVLVGTGVIVIVGNLDFVDLV